MKTSVYAHCREARGIPSNHDVQLEASLRIAPDEWHCPLRLPPHLPHTLVSANTKNIATCLTAPARPRPPRAPAAMRLFTHNLLVCNVRACVETSQRTASAAPLNFPLRVRAKRTREPHAPLRARVHARPARAPRRSTPRRTA